MVRKRALEESSRRSELAGEKRQRAAPSLPIAIGEVMMLRSLQSYSSALEPMLRRVVHEEVERVVIRCAKTLYRSPSIKIRALEETPSFHLSFSKNLGPQIFTNSKITISTASKIEGETNNPLQILIVDPLTGKRIPAEALPFPIKVEILTLDGDFETCKDWSPDEYERSVLRERAGKRRLLAGDVNVTVREGAGVIGELMFTDNSSWIRSRKFRLGARVVPGSCEGFRIREAATDAFVVKDHRCEFYKKHYPPSLSDEVWRLERIGKEGAFHKRLAAHGINTVQDFLKLWAINPTTLRKILGGMSDKMWEGTIDHAKTCCMPNKLHLCYSQHCAILLNPICQVVGIMFNGQIYPANQLTEIHKPYVKRLVEDAYKRWNELTEVDGCGDENALPPGDLLMQMVAQSPSIPIHQENASSNHLHGLIIEELADVASFPNALQVGDSDGRNKPACFATALQEDHMYKFSDMSDDDSLQFGELFKESG